MNWYEYIGKIASVIGIVAVATEFFLYYTSGTADLDLGPDSEQF